VLQKLSLLSFSLIHFGLIYGALQSRSTLIAAGLVACAILVVVAYAFMLREKQEVAANYLQIPYASFGAAFTYYLSIEVQLGPVLAAGIVGLLGHYLPCWIRSKSLNSFSVAVYCGAFVGMSSAQVLPNEMMAAFGGALSGLGLILFRNHLNGIGGKLGSIAFASVLAVSFIYLSLYG